jgi:hypothetical protein
MVFAAVQVASDQSGLKEINFALRLYQGGVDRGDVLGDARGEGGNQALAFGGYPWVEITRGRRREAQTGR